MWCRWSFAPFAVRAAIAAATLSAVAARQISDQFGTGRFALLFKPGTYGSAAQPLRFNVGYYTEVAGLGLNPITEGQNVRLPIPDLTEERRKELAKLAGSYAEKARVAVRNVRRDGMDMLKTDEKKNEISEDEHKRLETEVQKLTDETIKEIDAAAAAKEKEILQK